MANLFKDLPHLLGTITNLDGAQSMRALVSINAELKRRQRLFAENDVNHINQYQKKYKLGEVSEPMPHLFLISDEFAELKTNQPDFMKELVSTAAKDSNVDDFFWKVMTKLDDMEDIPKVFSEFVTSNGAITNVLSKLPVDKQDDIINALVRTSERSGQVFNTVMTWVNKAGNISEWITKIAGSKPAQILGKVADSGLGKVISSPWLMPVANGTISGFSSYFDSTDKAHKDVGKAVAGGIIDGIASIGPIDGALIGAKFGPWGAIAGLSFGAISQTLQFIYPDGVDKIKDGVYDLIDNTREIGKNIKKDVDKVVSNIGNSVVNNLAKYTHNVSELGSKAQSIISNFQVPELSWFG
ncbi:reticulocyte binding protein [Streptococcus suis]|nr:reticulocyte binding protein [Streptococcus suis]